jgi:hypothetical protein
VNPQVENNIFTFYDDTTDRLRGWSHISKPEQAGSYAGVQYGPNFRRYYVPEAELNQAPDSRNIMQDPSCNDVPVYESILVRRYHSGGSIHNNGIEPRFGSNQPDEGVNQNIQFSDLQAIVIEMRIDSAFSNILTEQEFGNPGVDTGEFTLWVVGLGTNALGGQPQVGARLRLDMDTYADRWIRITIETNGQGGNVALNQVLMQPVLHGNNGTDLFLGGDQNRYKEMGFSLKNYYIRLN